MTSPEGGANVLADNREAALLERARRIVPDYPWLALAMDPLGVLATSESDVLAPFKVMRYGHDAGDPSGVRHLVYPGDLGPVAQNLEVGKIYALRGFVAPSFGARDEGPRRLQYVTDQPGAPGAFDLSSIPAGLRYIEGQILRYNGDSVERFHNGRGGKEVHYQAFTMLDKDKNPAVNEGGQRADFATLEGLVTVLAGPTS